MKGFPDLPPVWLLGCIALGALVHLGFGPGALSNPTTQGVGIGVSFAGFALIVWSARAFHRHATPIEPHHTPRALITTGPYRYSRNPIYIGIVVILAGAVVWWGRPLLGLLVPLLAAILEIRFIRPEEDTLRAAFGDAAETYLAATNRWL